MQVLFLQLGCVIADRPESKIMGGWPANILQVPYFVAIRVISNGTFTRRKGQPFCGATIINSQWLISAGHCCHKPITKGLVVGFIMGVDHLSDTENMLRKNNSLPRPDLMVVHPEYSHLVVGTTRVLHEMALNDLCLLRLGHHVQFSPFINMAALPWTAYDNEFAGKSLVASGYGFDGLTRLGSDILLSTNMKWVPHDFCEAEMIAVSPGEPSVYNPEFNICTTSVDDVKRVICYGDSGGGIIYKDSITQCNVIVGVISNTDDCNKVSISVNVSFYKKWIQDTMDRFSSNKSELDREQYFYPARNRIDQNE